MTTINIAATSIVIVFFLLWTLDVVFKKLDNENRSSQYFSLGIIFCCEGIICVFYGFLYPEVPYQYIYELNSNTFNDAVIQHLSSGAIALYLWESVTMRHCHHWAIIQCHHWATIFINILMLNGIFIPFSGICYIFDMLPFGPMLLFLGFRIQFASKYPIIIQKLSSFCAYFWLIMSIISSIGCILLAIHCFVNTEKVSIYITILFVILFPALVKTQYGFFQHLKKFENNSKMH